MLIRVWHRRAGPGNMPTGSVAPRSAGAPPKPWNKMATCVFAFVVAVAVDVGPAGAPAGAAGRAEAVPGMM